MIVSLLKWNQKGQTQAKHNNDATCKTSFLKGSLSLPRYAGFQKIMSVDKWIIISDLPLKGQIILVCNNYFFFFNIQDDLIKSRSQAMLQFHSVHENTARNYLSVVLLCSGRRTVSMAQRHDPNSSGFHKHEVGVKW